MKKEIPFFLNYLLKRELTYKTEQSRFSFAPAVYMTEQMKNVQERTKSTLEKEISQFIKDCFIKFKFRELWFHPAYISEQINKNARYKYSESAIREHLKFDKGMGNPKQKRFPIFHIIDMTGNGDFKIQILEHKNERAFCFKYEDWITENEIKENDLKFEDENL